MRTRTTTPGTRIRLGAVLTAFGAAGIVAGASLAGAATGWTRTPGAGFAGASIHVASSADTLCLWEPPQDPQLSAAADTPTVAADPAPGGGSADTSSTTSTTTGSTGVDGVRVELRLTRLGIDVPVGSVPVTSGGAWAGDFTVPPVDQAPAAGYQLIPTCVVDDASLPGVISFDFDPQSFGIVEGPPPTTVTAPPTIPPPVTVDNSTEVQGARATRAAANTATQGPTLPRTGDGTLAVGLAGIAAVGVGGAALWWGARAARRSRTADAR